MHLFSDALLLSATDLSNHLGCEHLTELNRLVAYGKLTRPYHTDLALKVLEQRGQEHERAYVDHLRRSNLKIADLKGQPVSATIDAMASGVDVIVQARLEHGQWMGYADILMRVNGRSNFGDWAYEVQDTKLAQNTRAATILQLCLYSDLLSRLQGSVPAKMHVVKPGENFPSEEYNFAEFQAYYRFVKQNFERTIKGGGAKTYPESVAHCGICNWWSICDKQRHDDDHLSLVAGLRNMHIEELRRQNIRTLKEFATSAITDPDRGKIETLARKQEQARVQLEGRTENRLVHKLLPYEPGRGLYRLPQPCAGDIYFDIEGDAFYPDGSLEYLLGYAARDENRTLIYHRHWATTRSEEKKAFTAFMSFVIERWKKHPDLHIYHFAPYEPTAVKRLARVHAVFEKEVDDLLRGQRFVDLHAVFKEALLASVERYSLKDLEKFTDYVRLIDLREAGKARKALECALELNEFNSLAQATLDQVEKYNEDDCRATEALHRWLEDLRSREVASGKDISRPVPGDPEASENIRDMEIRSQALFDALTRDLPDEREAWSPEHHAKWLLAHQIDYFRREDKSAWWEYYRVHELDHEELLDERYAVTGLRFEKALPLKGRERIPSHRYSFPPQELSIDEGDQVVEVKGDDTRWTVTGISLENYTIDIKKTAKTIDRHPAAVHEFRRVDPKVLALALMDIAEKIDEYGLAPVWPYRASKDLLMRRQPRLAGGESLRPGPDVVGDAIRIALSLDKSILPIQGPPGTGKTYTAARMIIALNKAGKKIGITAISHSVIRTLFEKVKELCAEEGYQIGLVHKVSDDDIPVVPWIAHVADADGVIAALSEGKVAGGTAWLWADQAMIETLDYLFIDEAGQMSLSHALAASRAASNLILLGDPQQLEQPQKGSHPEGSDVAALTYLLGGRKTMPAEKGLFLPVTRRIHPSITAFTSEIFYEGKLTSLPGLERQVIGGGTAFDGAGLFYVPVTHRGNQNRSREEVSVIRAVVASLLEKGTWTSADRVTRRLTVDDILVVAPYNAQVSSLLEALPGFRIGTVDKFQGKEAPVVIYSMTSSSIEDAPRGMNFLFNPNRLNVATSRAKSICILVASPKLFEPECYTIDQMRWANGVCRYHEMATQIDQT